MVLKYINHGFLLSFVEMKQVTRKSLPSLRKLQKHMLYISKKAYLFILHSFMIPQLLNWAIAKCCGKQTGYLISQLCTDLGSTCLFNWDLDQVHSPDACYNVSFVRTSERLVNGKSRYIFSLVSNLRRDAVALTRGAVKLTFHCYGQWCHSSL